MSLLVIWSFWTPFKRILETISLSCPYEHSQNLPVVEKDTLPWGKGSRPHPPPSCMLSFLCYDKGNKKSLVIWSFWKPFKKILETILMSRHYEHSQNLPEVEGDSLPWGKVSPPSQPLCTLSFLCNDKRNWEEPGHLKFLNALQEDTGNNFSYLIPMHTVRIYLSQVQCSTNQLSWGGFSNPNSYMWYFLGLK